jgi:IS5 family transposase
MAAGEGRRPRPLGLEGIEVIMFRTVGDRPALWESLLPAEVLRRPAELARVDALLDDPAFFAPYFHPVLGRPSTPVECYLRLMFLKFRYRLGYESLCAEVSDSISWRRFCRIPLDAKGPHPTTLMKLTTRCGDSAVAGLNEALLAKAAGRSCCAARLRADTMVIGANVAYPTDSGLLARAIRRIAVTGRRIQAAGGATRTRMRDRSRAASRRAHAIAARLRSRAAQARDEKQAAVARATGELAGLAERAAREARQRLAGTMPDGATQRVSLHEPDARPIAKGRLGKPVEFGYKAQVTDNDDGVVLDYAVEQGNPADGPQLAPAIECVIKRTGKKPGTVTADRSYGEQSIEDELHALGVRHVVIPRKGKPRQGAPGRRTPASVPAGHQVADRQRRPESARSNEAMHGTAPASTASKEPGPGQDTESWPTTWSAPWPADSS